MKFTNVRELKSKTSALLDAVEQGERLIITYHGKPRAMITKVSEDDIQMKDAIPQGNVRKLKKKRPVSLQGIATGSKVTAKDFEEAKMAWQSQ